MMHVIPFSPVQSSSPVFVCLNFVPVLPGDTYAATLAWGVSPPFNFPNDTYGKVVFSLPCLALFAVRFRGVG